MTKSDFDPEGRHWSILTKSRGGVVSVIRDLTLAEVRSVYDRLNPWYGLVAYKGDGVGRNTEESDIILREVFGPPGWTMASLGGARWPRDATPEEQKAEDARKEFFRQYAGH